MSLEVGTKAEKRLTSQLPYHVKERVASSSSTEIKSDLITGFIDKWCKNANNYSQIKKDLAINKNFVFGKIKPKPPAKPDVPPRAKKPHLSLREKRKLGLYKLTRTGLKYNDFIKLNDLWQQYMLDRLDIDASCYQRGELKISDKNWEQLSGRLYKADYHGAAVSVVRSRCPSLVGVEGIVVMETKRTFRVLSKDDIVRTIPKETSVFQLKLDRLLLTVIGKNLCVKPAERATKKVRQFFVQDL